MEITKVKKWQLLLLLLICTITQSNSYAPVSIMNLYAHADVVALVRIQSGELIEGTDIPCGAKYQAKVIHSIKNAQLGQKLTFGYYHHIEIGSEYLVFLEKKHLNQWPKLSILSGYEKYRAQFDRQCQSKHPDYNLIRSGTSYFKLQYNSDLSDSQGFKVNTSSVIIPQGAKPQHSKKGECDPWNCVWVSKKAMFNLFNSE